MMRITKLIGMAAAVLLTVGSSAKELYPKLPGELIKGTGKITGAVGFDNGLLHVAGKRLYRIYDCRKNPMQPEKIGELRVNGHRGSRQIVIHRGYAYVTNRENGLHVFDVRNPKRPEYCGNFDTAEMATGVEASGNLLFIALRNYGIEFFDITDPARPKELYRVPTNEAQSCYARGNLLAVGNWSGAHVQMFDVSAPCKPKELYRLKLDGHGDGVWFNDRYLYAATGHHSRTGTRRERFGHGHGLEIFDLKTQGGPRRIAKIKFPQFYALGNDMWAPVPAGKLMAVADTHNGLFLVDPAVPAAPKVIGRFQLPSKNVKERILHNGEFPISATRKLLGLPPDGPVPIPEAVVSAVSGQGAIYLSGISSGIWAVKVPQALPAVKAPQHTGKNFTPAVPEIKGFSRIAFDGMVRSAAAAGDKLYVAAGQDGVWCLTAGQGSVNKFKVLNEYAYAVAVHQELLTVGGKAGLRTFRIDKDGNLAPRSGISMKNAMQIVHLYCDGKVALGCSRGGSFDLIDLRNAAKPEKIGNFPVNRLLYQDYFPESLIDGLLPVPSGNGGVFWFKIAGGRGEQVHHSNDQFGAGAGFCTFHDRFVISRSRKLFFADPADFGAAGFAAPVKLQADVSGLASCDNSDTVWFISRNTGMVNTMNLKNTPVITGSWNFAPGTPERIVFWQGRAVVPAGFGGLYLQNK